MNLFLIFDVVFKLHFFHFYDVSFAARTHVGTQCKCVRAYKHQVCTSGGSFHTSAGNIDANVDNFAVQCPNNKSDTVSVSRCCTCVY